jgi:RNA polymerase-binding transcription factor DksA
MSRPELPQVRHSLDERADALEQEIIAKQAGLRTAPVEAGDRKDEADASATGAVAAAEIERDLAELREIAAARVRIAEGRYGLCIDCGEAIDAARLAAQPTALRCLACQASAERSARPG